MIERPSPFVATETLGLTVLYSPDSQMAERSFALDASLLIGRKRAPGVDIGLGDKRVSRRHARLVREGHRFVLLDLGSTNGTRWEGRACAQREVTPGTIIRVGDTVFEFAGLAERQDQNPILVGPSAAHQRALRQAEDASRSDGPVLLLGEEGTGKGCFARLLHGQSGRSGMLVTRNGDAIPTVQELFACFDEARGGTLLVEDVEDLPAEVQEALLGLLGMPTEVRVVAASRSALQFESVAGGFLGALYDELAECTIQLAPLRERRRDIMPLFARFLRELQPERRVVWNAGFVQALLLHPWHRNMRELRYLVRALAESAPNVSELRREHFRAALRGGSLPPPPLGPNAGHRSPSREELVAVLERHRGNVEHVAAVLGQHGRQVYRWLKRHALDPNQFRSRD